MVPLMSMSVAVTVVRTSTRPLCAAVALAVSLMCAVIGVAASTTPMTGITGMTGMASAVSTSGVASINDKGEAAVASVAAARTMELGSGGGPTLASMCGSPCAPNIAGACAVAAGLTATALLALFFALRRDTFLGLLARIAPLFHVRRPRREPTPWTVLSLSFLCVLRV